MASKPKKKVAAPRMRRAADLVKRSYYIREQLADTFKYHSNDNISLPLSGAMLLWLALDEMPSIREAAIRMANDTSTLPTMDDEDDGRKATMREARKLAKVIKEEAMAAIVADVTRKMKPEDQLQFVKEAKELATSK